jgi:hypothetical protein
MELMKKAVGLTVAILALFSLLWTASGIVVNAQGPINDDPVRALYLYDRPYSVPGNTWVWFKFDHNGDRTKLIQINLVNGHALGLDYRLYTQDQMDHLNDDKFVGRGNVNQVPCDAGRCDSPDLFWQGTFNIAGTFYVAVMNPKNVPVAFRILINGESVSLCNEPPPLQVLAADTPAGLTLAQPTTTPPFANPLPTSASGLPTTTPPFGASLPTTTPPFGALATLTPLGTGPVNPPAPPAPIATATPQPPVNNSPYFAVFVPDNRPVAILANSELWYKFDYSGDRSKITLALPNGNAWGFDFKLYTNEQAFRVYTEDKFVGRGSAINQACDTGKCTADDLTWVGNFNIAGTYFVRVINTKPLPQTFVLQIAGTAVNIIGQ